MFTNRITEFLAAPRLADQPRGNGEVPAGFVAIPRAGVPLPTASIYDVARRAAIQEAREKLLALLRSRQTLIQGN